MSVAEFFDSDRLYRCQRAIGYHFRDVSLLENALTHSSVKGENRPSYERLEFLGDSVVGLIVGEFLYKRHPEFQEGELTKVKSEVVSTTGLAKAAALVELESFLAVGRGIQMKDGLPRGLVADVFEAVVGAVYLDRGYEAVRLYVLDHLRPFIDEALSDGGPRNYKSVLQQVAQQDHRDTAPLRRDPPLRPRPRPRLRGRRDRRGPALPVVHGRDEEGRRAAAAKRALQEILREQKRKGGGRRRRS